MDWNQYTYLHQPYGKIWYNSTFWAGEWPFKPNLSNIFHFHGYRNDIFLHLMQLLEPCCPHALPRWYAPTVGNARHNSPAKQLQKRMQLALLVTVCGSSIRDLVCMQGRVSHRQIWNWVLFFCSVYFYLLPKCNAKTVLNQFLCVLTGGKQNIAFKLHRATVHLEDMFLNLDVGLRCHVYRNLLFPKNHWTFKWRGVRTCMAGVGSSK